MEGAYGNSNDDGANILPTNAPRRCALDDKRTVVPWMLSARTLYALNYINTFGLCNASIYSRRRRTMNVVNRCIVYTRLTHWSLVVVAIIPLEHQHVVYMCLFPFSHDPSKLMTTRRYLSKRLSHDLCSTCAVSARCSHNNAMLD